MTESNLSLDYRESCEKYRSSVFTIHSVSKNASALKSMDLGTAAQMGARMAHDLEQDEQICSRAVYLDSGNTCYLIVTRGFRKLNVLEMMGALLWYQKQGHDIEGDIAFSLTGSDIMQGVDMYSGQRRRF